MSKLDTCDSQGKGVPETLEANLLADRSAAFAEDQDERLDQCAYGGPHHKPTGLLHNAPWLDEGRCSEVRFIAEMRRSGVNGMTYAEEKIVLQRGTDYTRDILDLLEDGPSEVELYTADFLDAFLNLPVDQDQQKKVRAGQFTARIRPTGLIHAKTVRLPLVWMKQFLQGLHGGLSWNRWVSDRHAHPLQWVVRADEFQITAGEPGLMAVYQLLALLLSLTVWQRLFRHCRLGLLVLLDSEFALRVVIKLASPHPVLNRLAAELALCLEDLQAEASTGQHWRNTVNIEADALSRLQVYLSAELYLSAAMMRKQKSGAWADGKRKELRWVPLQGFRTAMLEHGRGPSEQHELQALGAGRSNDRREDPEGEGEVGQDVVFEVEPNGAGHPQARNMVLATPAVLGLEEGMWDYSASPCYDGSNMQLDHIVYDCAPEVSPLKL
ncbi:unnamed protein product, partial [Cladocopium goreaui]